MPSWLWFLIGFVSAFVVSFGALVGWWFLIVSREKRSPIPHAEIDHIIVRDIGTLTYSRRN